MLHGFALMLVGLGVVAKGIAGMIDDMRFKKISQEWKERERHGKGGQGSEAAGTDGGTIDTPAAKPAGKARKDGK